MNTLDIDFVAKATEAKVISQVHKSFVGFGTDTRKNLQSCLFIALKGEQFDAHKFLENAIHNGAAGVLVHAWPDNLKSYEDKVSVLLVKDTLKALQKLAQARRRQLKPKVVALTGSNGKTTTKEFTAALLEEVFKVHYSKGSFNNHWGVPFSILEMDSDKNVLVLEMGMNHAGEIANLVKIAEPDIVACTTVGTAHIEHFGSQEGIAKAKEEIYEFCAKDTTRIYNIDNPWTRKMWERGKTRYKDADLYSFSLKDPQANVFLELQEMSLENLKIKGSIQGVFGEALIPVFGRQNLINLAAAATLGLAAGLKPREIWQGFPRCKTNWGRNQLLNLASGARMIFDGYNANPDSMKALIENLKEVKVSGRKIGVFGEMLELGDFSAGYHQELAEIIGQSGFDSIYFIGADAEAFRRGLNKVENNSKQSIWTEFREEMAEELAHEVKNGDLVVVKGSRGMKLERFVKSCGPQGDF